MKKLLLLGIVPIICLTMLTGCMPGFYTVGTLYTSVKTPSAAVAYYGPSANQAAKVAKATATNILGVVAIGDASLEAAMKQVGMTKVHHVDQEVTSILGLFSTYTIYVYGE
ncbi:MAG: TRL domain-containing protein [candidate division WOR-3 bacterium]